MQCISSNSLLVLNEKLSRFLFSTLFVTLTSFLFFLFFHSLLGPIAAYKTPCSQPPGSTVSVGTASTRLSSVGQWLARPGQPKNTHPVPAHPAASSGCTFSFFCPVSIQWGPTTNEERRQSLQTEPQQQDLIPAHP